MLETTTSFGDISSIQPFKKQELAEIKEHITTLQSKEDALEEDTDKYLRTILSEQHVIQYLAHAQHLCHFFSHYLVHDNNLTVFSFSYQALTSHIIKGLRVMLKLLIIVIITPIVAAIFDIPVVALDTPDISIASFDYWSIGHFLCGISLFVFAFTFGWIIKNLTGDPKDPINEPAFKSFVHYWIFVVIFAVLWEVIENTLLYMVDIKVEFDSVANVITDITIWGFGGCVSWYMTDLMFLSDKYLRAYYIYGIMSLTMGVLIFVVFGFLTTS